MWREKKTEGEGVTRREVEGELRREEDNLLELQRGEGQRTKRGEPDCWQASKWQHLDRSVLPIPWHEKERGGVSVWEPRHLFIYLFIFQEFLLKFRRHKFHRPSSDKVPFFCVVL